MSKITVTIELSESFSKWLVFSWLAPSLIILFGAGDWILGNRAVGWNNKIPIGIESNEQL